MSTAHADTAPILSHGTNRVVVQIGEDAKAAEINVYYHRPAETEADAPIVFVLHGLNRNADDYRDNWIELANKGRFIVLAPEFSDVDFPATSGYNLGNIVNAAGDPKPEAKWSFSVIEHIFDGITSANGFLAQRYDMFGHSAGSQFVHRYAMLMPSARIRTAVTANAGWYTLPDFKIEYPYGLRGTPTTEDHLKIAFERNLITLLGTRDDDPYHRNLRRSPEAMLQGRHRLERGENFYGAAKAKAKAMNVKFNWQIKLAEGVAHSNREIAPHAARFLGMPLSEQDKNNSRKN